MKTIITTTIWILAGVYCNKPLLSIAQNQRYISSMEKYIAMLDTASTSVTLWQCANGFERIGNAEKTEWLPQYWAAYSFVMMTIIGKDKEQVDIYCDKADAFLEKAEAISANNSEILTLKGFASAMRIQVNPMMRGRKYGPISGEFYEQAMKADESNPRPYYLRGQGIMNTPVMFGGGAEKACPYLTKAMKKFETFKPSSNIMPNWGLAHCKKVFEENCK